MKNNIQLLRKKAKLTQEELGKRLEVSRQTINSLEKGRYNPSIVLAFKIANIFKRNIEDIFIYDELDEEAGI
ncbi:MAG: helix-turn-helix transcriptional regulator [Vallitaleaceae bacterium]|nr:helix-turn-helix transcriptional regulator [Vallitaleaceae bacterium]